MTKLTNFTLGMFLLVGVSNTTLGAIFEIKETKARYISEKTVCDNVKDVLEKTSSIVNNIVPAQERIKLLTCGLSDEGKAFNTFVAQVEIHGFDCISEDYTLAEIPSEGFRYFDSLIESVDGLRLLSEKIPGKKKAKKYFFGVRKCK